MNVIVSNKQKEIIDNANIDAIKDLNGLFNVDDLVNKFKNYFFSKMILDATSVVDFATRDVLQKLVDEIGSDRLIILLPSKPEPPEEFKKMLIDLKIYNYSNNIDDVVGFIEKPNTYENAMDGLMNSYGKGNGYYVDSSIKDGEDKDPEYDNAQDMNNNSEDSTENSLINNNNNFDINSNHESLGDIMSRFNVHYEGNGENNEHHVTEPQENNVYQTNNIGLESINFSENKPINNVSSNNKNVFLNMDDYSDNTTYDTQKEKKIIGFRNVTSHAGSTSLIHMLQQVAQNINDNVLSLEINKDDFKLFRNNKMISVKENEVANIINSLRENLVFVDLNDCNDDSFCTDIMYLIEPSIIKLNRLMMTDRNIFDKLKNKKVILNQSMLSSEDIPILEKEAGMKFFDNITSLNDRNNNKAIEDLLKKLLD